MRPVAPMFNPDAKFGLRVRVAREINYDFENERKKLKEDMKLRRKQYKQEYWQMQTQIENKHFEDFRAERKTKQRNDLDKWRTAICKMAKNAQDHVKYLEKKEERTLEKMRMTDIKNMRKSINNKMMLDSMDMDAEKNWPTMANLQDKIDADVIIPQNVLNYKDYQNKLQRLAIFAELGDHDAMQAVLDNQLIIEKKNTLLQPVFRDLKSMIRHMSHTPEYELLRDYVNKRKQIEKSIRAQSSEAWKQKSLD